MPERLEHLLLASGWRAPELVDVVAQVRPARVGRPCREPTARARLPHLGNDAHPGEPGIRPSRTPWDVGEAASSPDCGAHFCVHWAAIGVDAPSLVDRDHDGVPDYVERVLAEREALQSTGIGEGVAIPHGALAQLEAQYAALLIVPEGVDFAAIDGDKVTILFAVIGPKRATGEHLKTLARVSRLLRNRGFRDRLVACRDGHAAFDLIASEESGAK